MDDKHNVNTLLLHVKPVVKKPSSLLSEAAPWQNYVACVCMCETERKRLRQIQAECAAVNWCFLWLSRPRFPSSTTSYVSGPSRGLEGGAGAAVNRFIFPMPLQAAFTSNRIKQRGSFSPDSRTCSVHITVKNTANMWRTECGNTKLNFEIHIFIFINNLDI